MTFQKYFSPLDVIYTFGERFIHNFEDIRIQFMNPLRIKPMTLAMLVPCSAGYRHHTFVTCGA